MYANNDDLDYISGCSLLKSNGTLCVVVVLLLCRGGWIVRWCRVNDSLYLSYQVAYVDAS
jgi:hypothetical protein